MADEPAKPLPPACPPQYGMGMSPAGFTMNPGAANFGPQMGGMMYMPGGCTPRPLCAPFGAVPALQARCACMGAWVLGCTGQLACHVREPTVQQAAS